MEADGDVEPDVNAIRAAEAPDPDEEDEEVAAASEDAGPAAAAAAKMTAEEAIAELRGLVADEPGRETLWRLLMLALYAAGRQAEALEAYQEARRYLADELGLDPSPELVEAFLVQRRTGERLDFLAQTGTEAIDVEAGDLSGSDDGAFRSSRLLIRRRLRRRGQQGEKEAKCSHAGRNSKE